MYIDPHNLGEIGRARHANLLREADERPVELPVRYAIRFRRWLRRLFRRHNQFASMKPRVKQASFRP